MWWHRKNNRQSPISNATCTFVYNKDRLKEIIHTLWVLYETKDTKLTNCKKYYFHDSFVQWRRFCFCILFVYCMTDIWADTKYNVMSFYVLNEKSSKQKETKQNREVIYIYFLVLSGYNSGLLTTRMCVRCGTN